MHQVLLNAFQKLLDEEPKPSALPGWRDSRLELPPTHNPCPQNIYGAAHCWAEALARVYSRDDGGAIYA